MYEPRNVAAAIASQQAADEILAIIMERKEAGGDDPLQWSGLDFFKAIVPLLWKASQSTLDPMPPAAYVDLLRAHADSVERLCCN